MWISQNQELSCLHPAGAILTPVTQPAVQAQAPACLWGVQNSTGQGAADAPPDCAAVRALEAV